MAEQIKKSLKENIKGFWDWLWNSESIWSYIVFLVLVFVIVKFIFLPGLGLLMNTSLPLAIVESSSMDHNALAYCKIYDQNYQCLANAEDYMICDKKFNSKQFLDGNRYWDACGEWYEANMNITQEQFSSFSFENGFRKGDLMIIYGKKSINIGDVIVFDAGRNHPVIHRAVLLNPIQTKGDHNPNQLSSEKSIDEDKVIGTAVLRIPYVGWIKLFFVELLNGFR